ncbi:MAG: class I SAM-dependent methyltransferase [Desulfobacteraceae bacterium]|nr:class I SAM-dependent methyltransferase [Desulfobacteraceae bacterium]
MIKQFLSSQAGHPKGMIGRLFALLMNKGNKDVYDGIMDMLDVTPQTSLLEIGFGNGQLLLEIEKTHPKRICGIDISETMMAAAQKKFKKAGLTDRIEIDRAGTEAIPFDDETFDTVLTSNTIYFWKDLRQGLTEIHRVLRKGGCFINGFATVKGLKDHSFTEYNFKKYELADFKKASIETGFKVEDQIEIIKDKAYCVKIIKQ